MPALISIVIATTLMMVDGDRIVMANTLMMVDGDRSLSDGASLKGMTVSKAAMAAIKIAC